MNKFEVNIKNFQSLKNITLDVRGITLIVGINNVGKSAIVRAIHACLYGRRGRDFVRKGTKACTVNITFDDHQIYMYRHVKSPSYYIIDGERYTKLGAAGRPVKELEALGFRIIEYGKGNKANLHFAMQGEPAFLVSYPAHHVFDFISCIMQEQKLYTVLQSMNKDLKTSQKLMIKREGEIEAYKNNIIQRKKDYESLVELIKKSSDPIARLQKIYNNIQSAESLIDSISQLQEQLEGIERLIPQVDGLLGKAVTVYDEMMSVQKVISEANETISNYHVLDESLQYVNEEIERIECFDDINESYEEVKRRIERLIDAKNVLSDIEKLLSEMRSLKDALTQCDAELTTAQSAYDKEIGQLDICPFCGSKIGGKS